MAKNLVREIYLNLYEEDLNMNHMSGSILTQAGVELGVNAFDELPSREVIRRNHSMDQVSHRKQRLGDKQKSFSLKTMEVVL